MELLGLGDLADDENLKTAAQRWENRHLIDQPIADAIAKFNRNELCDKLLELRMLHGRINTYHDFMKHEQTKHTDAVYWHDYPGIGSLPFANIPGMENWVQMPSCYIPLSWANIPIRC